MERKKVIITAGNRGIGAAIAVKFAQAGYDVSLSYAHSRESAEEVAEKVRACGGRCFLHKAVLEEEGTAEAFIHESIQELGGVDVFVNNAIRPGLGGGLLDIDTVEIDACRFASGNFV